ncbi:MAG: TatD family deoxyribonuclease, partial [Chitinophagaceae bacterium]
FEEELEVVKQWLENRNFSAIGEIGLDLYWDKTYIDNQYEAFRRQIVWALKYDLPIAIHSRNATRECIEVLKEFPEKKVKGIFHCFGGSPQEAEDIINLGMYLGIGGVVTYKNSGLDKVLAGVGLSNLVLETDAPYLSPVPHRGKRNESSFLPLVAEKLASIYSTTADEIDRVTTLNATNIFGKLI